MWLVIYECYLKRGGERQERACVCACVSLLMRSSFDVTFPGETKQSILIRDEVLLNSFSFCRDFVCLFPFALCPIGPVLVHQASIVNLSCVLNSSLSGWGGADFVSVPYQCDSFNNFGRQGRWVLASTNKLNVPTLNSLVACHRGCHVRCSCNKSTSKTSEMRVSFAVKILSCLMQCRSVELPKLHEKTHLKCSYLPLVVCSHADITLLPPPQRDI